MKKVSVILCLLLWVAMSGFAAEERTTKEIFNDPSVASVTITGDQLRLRTHPDLDGYIITTLRKDVYKRQMQRYQLRPARQMRQKNVRWHLVPTL